MPPPQLNVAPVVVDEADSVSLTLLQVKTVGVDIVTTGAVMFCITFTVAEPVQPLAGSVTVTV